MSWCKYGYHQHSNYTLQRATIMICLRGSILILNSMGPKTKPWDTPYWPWIISDLEKERHDIWPSMVTHVSCPQHLFVKRRTLNWSNLIPEIPSQVLSLSSEIEWHTVLCQILNSGLTSQDCKGARVSSSCQGSLCTVP